MVVSIGVDGKGINGRRVQSLSLVMVAGVSFVHFNSRFLSHNIFLSAIYLMHHFFFGSWFLTSQRHIIKRGMLINDLN